MVSCSNTGLKLQLSSIAAIENIIGVRGLLMNFTHNAGLAFFSFLSVKDFFAAAAADMTVADVYNAGFSLG